jgi:dihydrofolate reductase
LTEIDASYDADVFFPEFDKDKYKRTVLSDIEENDTHYQHIEYLKIA